MRERNQKHKHLHYLQSSAFILMSDDACLCVCVWYWCSSVMYMQTWFQWRATVTECTCACSVSATPLNSRTYVTCSYAFVSCHVSKSVCTISLFSSSSSTAAGISGDFDVIQPRPSKPNPALESLDVWESLRSRWLEDLHTTTWEFQAEGRGGGGGDIWAIRASLSSYSP